MQGKGKIGNFERTLLLHPQTTYKGKPQMEPWHKPWQTKDTPLQTKYIMYVCTCMQMMTLKNVYAVYYDITYVHADYNDRCVDIRAYVPFPVPVPWQGT